LFHHINLSTVARYPDEYNRKNRFSTKTLSLVDTKINFCRRLRPITFKNIKTLYEYIRKI